jgi:hypothetical protein
MSFTVDGRGSPYVQGSILGGSDAFGGNRMAGAGAIYEVALHTLVGLIIHQVSSSRPTLLTPAG